MLVNVALAHPEPERRAARSVVGRWRLAHQLRDLRRTGAYRPEQAV